MITGKNKPSLLDYAPNVHGHRVFLGALAAWEKKMAGKIFCCCCAGIRERGEKGWVIIDHNPDELILANRRLFVCHDCQQPISK